MTAFTKSLAAIVLLCCASALMAAEPHPRLYFTQADLPKLRELRGGGRHQQMWKNMQASAEWALTRPLRREWIAPVSPDPNYENLYDRFYAIMGDLAITEHLGFTYAVSGEKRFGEAARQWTLASCRAWKHEADGEPDGGKAYAVMRLLKGIAVGYDTAYDCFTEAERQEIRDAIVSVGEKYYTGYFTTPTIAGPTFHTHHATVEWASFGVAALALHGEVPQAARWLDATTKKFEDHLLPTGLEADGAQIEGATFWASTMHYRIFFMDALRRVTGRDLFKKFEKQMSADIALASIVGQHKLGWAQANQSVLLAPSYGQLDYYAPVLLFLAREYRRPLCQHLALWDQSLGGIQRTRFITPHGEELSFELGGYSFVWFDESALDEVTDQKLSFHFPSTDDAYLRASWKPDDLLVGVRKGEIVASAGGQAVLIEPFDWREPVAKLHIKTVEDNGSAATINCENESAEKLTVELHRPGKLIIRRRVKGDWQWTCRGEPQRADNDLIWKDGPRVHVAAGTISKWEPAVDAPKLSVGFGKLVMADPLPEKFSRCTITPPVDGEIVVEIEGR